MTTIVFAHPWKGSFNNEILNKVETRLKSLDKAYQEIDLYGDGFDPVLNVKELSVYSKGIPLDPIAVRYKKMIESTDEIIFIFPIWWGTMPAILKGFFDKVLLVNSAFNYENGWTPLLKIDSSFVFTTSEGKTEEFRNSIENNFVPSMLESVGIRDTLWLNCEQISGTPEHRKEFLDRITAAIK